MSYGSALQRRLDTDLIDRIEASGPQKTERKVAKVKRKGRPAGSYRCARRNEARLARKGRAKGSARRVKHLSYADILRINRMVAEQQAEAAAQAAKADPVKSAA
jgi:hypothetical protein